MHLIIKQKIALFGGFHALTDGSSDKDSGRMEMGVE